VRRIADWLAGAADSLTPAEIRMAARHLRDAVDGRPLDLGAVADLNRSGEFVTTGAPPAAPASAGGAAPRGRDAPG